MSATICLSSTLFGAAAMVESPDFLKNPQEVSTWLSLSDDALKPSCISIRDIPALQKFVTFANNGLPIFKESLRKYQNNNEENINSRISLIKRTIEYINDILAQLTQGSNPTTSKNLTTTLKDNLKRLIPPYNAYLESQRLCTRIVQHKKPLITTAFTAAAMIIITGELKYRYGTAAVTSGYNYGKEAVRAGYNYCFPDQKVAQALQQINSSKSSKELSTLPYSSYDLERLGVVDAYLRAAKKHKETKSERQVRIQKKATAKRNAEAKKQQAYAKQHLDPIRAEVRAAKQEEEKLIKEIQALSTIPALDVWMQNHQELLHDNSELSRLVDVQRKNILDGYINGRIARFLYYPVSYVFGW
jgi:hypothetical protein